MNIVTTFAKIITMKTLNVALILSLGLLVILSHLPISASDDFLTLPNPGLTPLNRFYFIDQWSESVQQFFTLGPEAKIKLQLSLISERIAEMKVVVENKGTKAPEIESIRSSIQQRLDLIAAIISKEQQKNRDTGNLQVIVQTGLEDAKRTLSSVLGENNQQLQDEILDNFTSIDGVTTNLEEQPSEDEQKGLSESPEQDVQEQDKNSLEAKKQDSVNSAGPQLAAASPTITTSGGQPFITSTPTPTPIPLTSNWSNSLLNVSGEYQSIAWNGNGYGAVFGRSGKLYFIKLDSSGNKLSESILATAPNNIHWTNIIWDGSKYGVVWPETNPHNLRFATVDIDGNMISNIPLTAGTDNASTERPAILWTGSEYVLVWSGGWPDHFNNPYLPTGIIYFTKIASDGQTFVINKKRAITNGDARAANGPIVSLAWNGTNFGVAWQDIRDSGDSNKPALYFNVLDSNGDKLINNDVKVSGAVRVGSPQVFTDGSNYTVFWRESTANDVNANSIYVAKLDPAGNKILANQNLNTKGDNEMRPSVAKIDNGYGIVWTSYPEQKLYFKSINSNAGIVIDNDLISTVSGDNDNAYLTLGDNKYSVIWRNVQNNQSQLYFGTK